MSSSDRVVVEFGGRLFLIPEEALEGHSIPISSIVREILHEVGASPESDGPELEEKLALWKNPVVEILPGDVPRSTEGIDQSETIRGGNDGNQE